MGWKGMAIGSFVGSLVARGYLGAIVGAIVGYQIEERFWPARRRRGAARAAQCYSDMPDARRSMIFCASVAAMLAKIAKADGRVTRDEIERVEAAFSRLGFSARARIYAVGVFRKAKDDARSIYDYACEFARVVESGEVRELLYEILWDVACADGKVGPNELDMLRRVPVSLRIRSDWFAYFAAMRLRGQTPSDGACDSLAAAYSVLGASASDTDESLRRKYRELAKKNHPDALRAQGLPEAMVGKATERMSRINEAWATIKEKRGF